MLSETLRDSLDHPNPRAFGINRRAFQTGAGKSRMFPADAVANGCERTRVENLAGESSVKPLRHPGAHRENIDHNRCVRIPQTACFLGLLPALQFDGSGEKRTDLRVALCARCFSPLKRNVLRHPVGFREEASYEWHDGDGRRIQIEQATRHPSSIAARVRGIRQRIPAASDSFRLEERHPSAGASESRIRTVVREADAYGWFLRQARQQLFGQPVAFRLPGFSWQSGRRVGRFSCCVAWLWKERLAASRFQDGPVKTFVGKMTLLFGER